MRLLMLFMLRLLAVPVLVWIMDSAATNTVCNTLSGASKTYICARSTWH